MQITGGLAINLNGPMTVAPPPCKPNPPIMGNVSYSINNNGNANTFANVTFTPQYDGGYGVSNYTVTSNTGISATSSGTTITVNGLTKGNTYTFTATATNVIGSSSPSNVSIAVTPVTVPSTPVITSASFVTCTQANILISVSDNGGNTITGYTVVSSPCNITANSTTNSVAITGLNGCNFYTFTVTANNYVGVSAQTSVSNVSVLPAPGYLYGWGSGSTGQLGICSTCPSFAPTRVGNLSSWLNMAGGYGHAAAVRADNTLWTWGKNTQGQLGQGNTTNYSSPKQVGALTNWKKVNSAAYATFAVKTDGTLWAWGYNTQGQLGLCNTTYKSSPTQVGALTNWKTVIGRYNTTFAIKTDGTLWSWGCNYAGQIGLSNRTNYSSPKQVGALTNWKSIATGPYGYFIAAIRTDGTLWAWGQNNQGQLGLCNTTCKSSPTQVGALTNWKLVSQTQTDTIAVKTDGTLWGWGLNCSGQLGLGNRTKYSSPKQVGALTNWKIPAAQGYTNTNAVKTDGTLWAIGGSNCQSALGLGIPALGIQYSSPKQVGALTTWTNIGTRLFGAFGISTS